MKILLLSSLKWSMYPKMFIDQKLHTISKMCMAIFLNWLKMQWYTLKEHFQLFLSKKIFGKYHISGISYHRRTRQRKKVYWIRIERKWSCLSSVPQRDYSKWLLEASFWTPERQEQRDTGEHKGERLVQTSQCLKNIWEEG